MSKQEYDVIMASVDEALEKKRAELEQELDQDPEYGVAIVRDQNAGLHENANYIEQRKHEEIERRLEEARPEIEAFGFEEHGGKDQMLRDILKDDFGNFGEADQQQDLHRESANQSPDASQAIEVNDHSQESDELKAQLLVDQDNISSQFKENAHDIQMDQGIGR